MHEMGIANSVLDAVRTEAARYPGSVLRSVGVRIGELAAIDADALRFCFDALVRDTELEALELAIEICPRRHRCSACGREIIVHNYDVRCSCGAQDQSECIGGDELDLAFIEVEEHEQSAVREESSE
jgi:hydrogenase nickel incorporation protein HypA/HybF